MEESLVAKRERGLVVGSGSGLAARDGRGALFSRVWSVALPPKTLRDSGLFPPTCAGRGRALLRHLRTEVNVLFSRLSSPADFCSCEWHRDLIPDSLNRLLSRCTAPTHNQPCLHGVLSVHRRLLPLLLSPVPRTRLLPKCPLHSHSPERCLSFRTNQAPLAESKMRHTQLSGALPPHIWSNYLEILPSFPSSPHASLFRGQKLRPFLSLPVQRMKSCQCPRPLQAFSLCQCQALNSTARPPIVIHGPFSHGATSFGQHHPHTLSACSLLGIGLLPP